MNENVFSNLADLDAAYLDAAYAGDAETAIIVFEQYLQDLPANLNLIRESITKKDIERFKQLRVSATSLFITLVSNAPI